MEWADMRGQNVRHKLFEKCILRIRKYLHPCIGENGFIEIRCIQFIIAIHAEDVGNQCINVGEIVRINERAGIEILYYIRGPPVNGNAARFVCVAYFFGHIPGILLVFKCNRKLVLLAVFYFTRRVCAGWNRSANIVQMLSTAIHPIALR